MNGLAPGVNAATGSRRSRVAGWIALAALLMPASAHAGVQLESETRSVTQGKPHENAQRSTIWLSDDKLRMEVTDSAEPDRKTEIIFRGDRDLLWAIDRKRGEYVQLDAGEMQQLGAEVARARSEMESKLAGMPPEQQEMMKQMLDDFAPSPEALPRIKIVDTGESRDIDGRSAHRYEVLRGSEKVGEAFTLAWEEASLSRSDFAAFEKFAEFQRALMSSLGAAAGTRYALDGIDVFDQVDGFPVLIRRVERGSTVSETRFRQVERFSPTEGYFDLPEGLARAGPIRGGGAAAK